MFEYQSSPFIFRWALWRVAGKGMRQGKITREDRRTIRNVIRNPRRETPIGGDIDILETIQGAAEAKAVADAAKTGEPVRFDFFSLMAILLEMLPVLLEWIKDLLDKLDDLDDDPV